MKIIRLQIPGTLLKYAGFAELFNELKWVKILKAFRYEQNQFFSLQQIKFKPESMMNLSNEIKSKFNPDTIQILEIKGDEIVCIMFQNNPAGFFPIIESPGPWAFLFPIHASREFILLNIISREDYIPNLFDTLSKYTESYELVAIEDLKGLNQISNQNYLPYPNFTKRQNEIASYAAKKGYFKSPKDITAQEIGDHFNISITAVNNHLRTAENKAMAYCFGRY
jgi:DNA-binding CsgD family transcriptional regulator